MPHHLGLFRRQQKSQIPQATRRRPYNRPYLSITRLPWPAFSPILRCSGANLPQAARNFSSCDRRALARQRSLRDSLRFLPAARKTSTDLRPSACGESLFATFNITTNISYFPRFAALTGLTAAGLREAIAARGFLSEAAIESTAQALEAQFGRCCFDLQASVPLCAPAPVRRFLEGPAGWAAASGTAAAALDGIAFASSSGRPRHEP